MHDATNGFAPILGEKPRVLILGSLPSVKSIAQQQYYGHPRNRFWPLMGALFQAGPELAYSERTERLMSAGIAVWDVLASGVRPGSLDSNIQRDSEHANPIAALLLQHSSLRHIFFNGRAAEQCFARHIQLPAQLERATTNLPSTSPANAAWQLPRLLTAWSALSDALN